uniref:Uncharacterized protein n=1 Tax=Oryza punctata TaxID=4537 RepID=A0A0E0LSC8_ORYPU
MQRRCLSLYVVLMLLFFAPLSVVVAGAGAGAGGSLIAIPSALDGNRTSHRQPIDNPRFNVMLWEKNEIKTRPTASHGFDDGMEVSYTVVMPFIEKLRRRCAGGVGGSHRRCDATAIRQFEEEVAPCLLVEWKAIREFTHTEFPYSRWLGPYYLDLAMQQRSQMLDLFCMNKPNVLPCLCFQFK